MIKTAFYDSVRNRSRKTKRWLGWLTFCGVLLLGQLSFAQFPAPYCNIDFPLNVEPITSVQFGSINNTTGNAINGTPSLEDFTAMSTDVQLTESYVIALKGNTDGGFTCWFRVFVDWNQDGDFDDAGESYDIGSIYNSTGLDAISASGAIAVPLDATLGSTRMRITKRFNVYSTACNTEGYGQAEDYTINVLPAPDCPSVADVSSSNVTDSTADLSWTGDGDSFDIEWGEAGFTPTGTPNVSGLTAPSYTLGSGTGEDLLPVTTYQYYIRQDCGTDGYGNWSGPYAFTTLCAVLTPPTATQTFDGFTGAAPATLPCWSEATGALDSPLTGTTSTWMNENYNLNYDATGGVNGTSAYINLYGTDNEWLISPQIDLGDGTTPYQVEFDVSITPWTGTAAVTDMGEKFVKVVVSTDGGATWSTTNVIQTYDNDNIPGNGGLIEYLPLTGYSGIVKIAFFAYSTSTAIDTRFYIDNFKVVEVPDCPYVADVSSSNVTDSTADLSWTGDGDSFDIEWGEAGFTPTGTPNVSGLTAPSYTLGSGTGEDLLPVTTYQYYIRQDCGTDGYGNWSGPYAFTTLCAVLIPPTATQTFDGFTGAAPATLPCWSEATGALDSPLTGTTSTWMNQNYNSNYDDTGGANGTSAYINLYGTDNEWLISPQIDLGDGTTPYQVEFDVSITPWTGTTPVTDMGEKFVKVVVSTDGGATWSTTNVIQTYDNDNIPGNGGLTEYLPLTGYSGIVKIAFFAYSTSTAIDTRFYIDNFKVVEVPDCPVVTGVSASNITTDSADLSWTSSGTTFDIEYGVTGFTPTGTPSVAGVSNNYTLGSLNPATTYQYYVRQDCDADGYSVWTGPFSFTTECDTFVLPFQEQFSSGVLPNCWTNTSSNPVANGLWKFAGAADYGAATAINGKPAGTYAWVDGSDPTDMNDITLTTPSVDVSSLTVPCVSFEYFSNNQEVANYPNNVFTVQVSDDGTTWETVFTDNTNDTVWREIEVPLETFTGTTLQVRFIVDKTIAPTGYAFYNDILLDNVRVIEAPTCPKPTDLTATNATATSVDLGWTSSGTLFDIKWGVSGFDVETEGTLIEGVTDNPYALSGLTQSTNYQFYVRRDCGAVDGLSVWAGPFSFTTTQVPVTLDYEEDFEGVHNWILNNGTQTNQWVVGEATANGGTHSLYISNDEGVTNNYTITSTSVVHAYRDVQIPADADSILLSFDWKSGGEGVTLFYDYFRVWVVPTTYTPVPGTQITTANSGGVQFGENFLLQTDWINQWYEIPSIDYAGQIVRLVFEWRNDGSAGTQPGAAIDNVEISVVTCPAPTGLAVDEFTLESAELSWLSSGTSFNIEYGTAGFTLGDGTAITDVTSPYSLEDLTAHTSYEYYVQQDCGSDGISAWSGPHFFHTGHCIPVSTNTSDYISSFVTTGGLPYDINNTGSGMSPGGYGNFGSMSVSHYETGSVDFTITNSATMGVNIWIDWNNNLEFEESEKVYASGATGTTFTGTITVPFGTPIGDYRMRVRGQWNNSNPEPCGTISYGEAEDYTFTVIDPPSCLPPFSPMATNISASSVSLSWQADGDLFDIEWGEEGFVQGTGVLIEGVSNPYVLGGLTGGVSYQFYVRQDCGEDDGYSMWNGPITFVPGVFEGDIPSLLNANPQVEDIACATSFAIDVPEGQQIASLNVQYIMTSSSPAWDTHQRSVLYSSTLGMGEPAVALAPNPQDFPGVVYYNRSVDFANGATGTVEFELKVWRTEGGSGCGDNLVYVENGSWILNATFEDIPSCPNPPTNLGYDNVTVSSVDLVWTSTEAGTFQLKWGDVGFNVETAGTEILDINAFSQTLSGLDSTIPYEFYVRRDCSDEDNEDYGEWVGPVRFNSGHCIPYSDTTHGITVFHTTNAIENVTYANQSPFGNGFVDKTDEFIVQEAGESLDFTSSYIGGAHGLRIWVDWNNDFIFDEDEIVFENISSNGSNPGVIEIPEDAAGNYRMRVRAQGNPATLPSACGEIPYGEAIDFTLSIPCDEIDAPTGLATQQFTAGDTLADLEVTGDNLVWYEDEDLTVTLDESTELVDDTTYYVVSTVGNCQSEFLAVTVEEVLGRIDFETFGFKYYPNPVSELLYLSANTPISDVTVINMLGQQIDVPVNSDNTSLDMSELPTGNYLIKVTIEGNSKMFKIVKR